MQKKIQKTTNVRSLWRAVIMQAVVDATNKSKNRRAISHKKQAKQWFHDKPDHTFVETCILAEMEPNYVKMKVNESNDYKANYLRYSHHGFVSELLVEIYRMLQSAPIGNFLALEDS